MDKCILKLAINDLNRKGERKYHKIRDQLKKRSNRKGQFSLSTFVPYLRRPLNSNPGLMKAVSALELFNLLCGVDNIAGLSSTWTFYVGVLFNLIRHQFYPYTAVSIWPVSSWNGFYPLYLCMHPTVRIWRTTIIYNIISRYLKILIFYGGVSCSLVMIKYKIMYAFYFGCFDILGLQSPVW